MKINADVLNIIFPIWNYEVDALCGDFSVITGPQMRAARALLGIDQRELAQLAGVSLPTIQRMEASEGTVRGVIDSLTKVVTALERAGIELLSENIPSRGAGRGVRLIEPTTVAQVARPPPKV
jgi:transcriptional regulator with XRE-family HTH domain